MVFTMPKVVPKIIHIPVISPLTDEQALYIKIWAKTHPDYEIRISINDDLVFDNFVYTFLFKKELNKQDIANDEIILRNKGQRLR